MPQSIPATQAERSLMGKVASSALILQLPRLHQAVRAAVSDLEFSIPINQAKRIANEIIDTPTHTATRPVLGVFFDPELHRKWRKDCQTRPE